MADTILFDLDGTLTEPAEGIVKSIVYSLEKLNYSLPPDTDFTKYIGPPLQASFAELLATEDKELIETAISFFRERFREKGQYENKVYEGIEDLLLKLTQNNRRLFIATSKPEIFAKNILNHFNLSHYFTGIYGSDLDGTRTNKAELLSYLLDQEAIDPKTAIMIGDREHDIIGAAVNNIDSIGVLWGYGSKEELESANPTYLCCDISQITALLL